MVLTMSLEDSAELLGTIPQQMERFLETHPQQGILRFEDGWRISLFTLAQWLNTSYPELVAILEDEVFGQMLDEVAEDDVLSGEESLAAYREYLAEVDV